MLTSLTIALQQIMPFFHNTSSTPATIPEMKYTDTILALHDGSDTVGVIHLRTLREHSIPQHSKEQKPSSPSQRTNVNFSEFYWVEANHTPNTHINKHYLLHKHNPPFPTTVQDSYK